MRDVERISQMRPSRAGSMFRDELSIQGDDASPSSLTPDRILANAAEGTRRVHRRATDND